MILTPDDMARCRAIRLPTDAIKAIVDEVADACAVASEEIISTSRKAAVVQARDLVCFIAARQQYSTGQIARALGRDHSSVVVAIARERERRKAQ